MNPFIERSSPNPFAREYYPTSPIPNKSCSLSTMTFFPYPMTNHGVLPSRQQNRPLRIRIKQPWRPSCLTSPHPRLPLTHPRRFLLCCNNEQDKSLRLTLVKCMPPKTTCHY